MVAEKMKGVDDFVFVLIAAIAILVALALLGPHLPRGGPEKKTETIETFSLGRVGLSSETVARETDLGTVKAGLLQTENLKYRRGVQLSTGYGSLEKGDWVIEVPEYYLDLAEKVVISFRVDQTNHYGPLIIKWNGGTVFEKSAGLTNYEVKIPADRISKENTLEVMAGGPGLMFWAATVYELSEFKVDLKYGPAKLYAFRLNQDELNAFDRGELQFYGEGTGRLTAKINGVEFFHGGADGVETIGFNYSTVPLKVGENILSLDSEGRVDLHGAKLKLYLMTNRLVRERSFNISGGEWDKLDKNQGRLDFQVDKIYREGGLTVKMNGENLYSGKPYQGWNNVTFSSDRVKKGENELVFSGTGEFDIGQAKVVAVLGE